MKIDHHDIVSEDVDVQDFLNKASLFISEQEYGMITCNNDYVQGFKNEVLLGAKSSISVSEKVVEELENYIESTTGPAYGYLGYSWNEELWNAPQVNPGAHEFPIATFFEPEHIISVGAQSIQYPPSAADLVRTILTLSIESYSNELHWQHNTSENTYIHNVESLRDHMRAGDIYEANYCISFESTCESKSIPTLWNQLQESSPNPYSAFFKFPKGCILSASPERFMKKSGKEVLSEPMKGTAPRSSDPKADLILKQELQANEKDRSENLMIVDLVRNDLARTAIPGTVEVTELFGVHSFPRVHQMISKIRAEVDPQVKPLTVIKEAFPMGSMTGAPKIKAMQLIDQYETFKREGFSGSLGWISKSGNFDLNVLIRSMFYSSDSEKLSFAVGSAITFESNAKDEYEECLLKAQGIFNLNPSSKMSDTLS